VERSETAEKKRLMRGTCKYAEEDDGDDELFDIVLDGSAPGVGGGGRVVASTLGRIAAQQRYGTVMIFKDR